MITLILLSILGVAAIVGTVTTTVRDGYRRQPARTPQHAPQRDELVSVLGRP